MADYYRRRVRAELQGIVSTAMDALSGSPSGTSTRKEEFRGSGHHLQDDLVPSNRHSLVRQQLVADDTVAGNIEMEVVGRQTR